MPLFRHAAMLMRQRHADVCLLITDADAAATLMPCQRR